MLKKLQIPEYRYFIFLFLVCLVLYVAGVLRVQSIFWGDSLYYYAYTRSIVVDRDIDFTNEAFDSNLGFPNPAEISQKTGRITNKFSPGTAVAWIPGMVFGQIVAFLGNLVVGYDFFVADGSGILPQFFVSVTAVFYSILGLWFVYKILRELFNKKIASLSIILLFLTTPIFYYTAMDPVNSHSISFLLSSVLLYQFLQILKSQITWQKVIPMGITAGFLILVRNQDLVVVLPVFIALLIAKKEPILAKLNWLTLFGGSAFFIFSAQLYTTVTLFGVLGSPYIIRGETFSWLRPDLIRVLFTLENGLFFFSPLLFFATLFLVTAAFKKQKKSAGNSLIVIAVASFLLQLYIVASWAPEIIGGPYGSRMFISILPQLSIGIALLVQFLIERYADKKFWFVFILLVAVFFMNMLAQTFWMLYRF